MARTVLDNGVILPAEYSDDWYEDMTSNLTKLDDVIGSDADKLSEEDVGAAALSNDYTDLDNKPDLNAYDQHLANTEIHVTAADKQKWNDNISQSYVLRYAGTSVTPSSTIAYSVLNNTDNVKAGDSIIDSSGQVFLIVSVDSVNQTVTVGAVLLTLALDANVMHLSGNETASGQKTFSDVATFNSLLYFTNSSVTKGTIPQSTVNPYRIYFGSGTNYGASLFNIDTSVSNTGVQSLGFRSAENVVSGDDTRMILIYDPNRAQPRYLSLKGDIEPNANNTYECGTSTSKWKSFNGLNPGVLSFPDLSSGLDISGYITVVNGTNKESLYTPPTNGWICVRLSRRSGALGVLLIQGDLAISGKNVEVESGVTTADATIPVIGGVQVSINSALADNVVSAKFYPNLGNV